MSANTSSNNNSDVRTRHEWVPGLILIVIGLFVLAAEVFEPQGGLFLGLLALAFAAVGLIGGKRGLMVPAGIIGGVSVGSYLVETVFAGASEMTLGAAFTLAMAGGFAAITLLTLALKAIDNNQKVMTWPLIPAAFLALFGGLFALGNASMIDTVGKASPLILVIIGLLMIVRRK